MLDILIKFKVIVIIVAFISFLQLATSDLSKSELFSIFVTRRRLCGFG